MGGLSLRDLIGPAYEECVLIRPFERQARIVRCGGDPVHFELSCGEERVVLPVREVKVLEDHGSLLVISIEVFVRALVDEDVLASLAEKEPG